MARQPHRRKRRSVSLSWRGGPLIFAAPDFTGGPVTGAAEPSLPALSARPRFLPSGTQPWGVVAAIAIAAFAAYGVRDAVNGATHHLPAGEAWNALRHVLVWGAPLVVIVAGVRLTQIPLRDYLGWTMPRPTDLALGLALAVAVGILPNLLQWAVTGKPVTAHQVAAYRNAIAAGWSNPGLVFAAWPWLLLVPLVEETVFRGFLWRSFVARLGHVGTLLATALLFTAIHYPQAIMPNGTFNEWPLIDHFIGGCALGAMRWRSGTSTVPIVMHAWLNIWVAIAVMVLLPLM
jgi:membrane protease YdiL (CAAX protease family)